MRAATLSLVALLGAGGFLRAAAALGHETERGAMARTGDAAAATAALPDEETGGPELEPPEGPTPGAGEPAPLPAAPQDPARLPLQRVTLDNGLRVVLNVDRSFPNVAVCVTYDVGARNERPGQAGFAHLFEHMMFQGSRNVPKGGHFTTVTARGGRTNATTSSEHTSYTQVLPAGDLELALWLEADRMKTLAITRESFENQRQVVQEEFRTRVTNAAYAAGRLRLQQLAFQGYFPYEHTALGSMDDLDAARIEWVREFHQSYYAPNNAVLSIVGDFDPDRALELVREHFADAKPQPRIPEVESARKLRQTSERLSVLEDANAKTPGAFYGWVIPPARTPEHYALELAGLVLADGESSRLHQLLVRDKPLASSVGAFTKHHRGPSLLGLHVVIAKGSSIDKAQKVIDAELKRLRVAGPSRAELDRAKARLKTRFVLRLESRARRAALLGWYEALWGDATFVQTELASYDRVTEADVRNAVAEHLLETRRTIVEIYPPGWVKDEYPVHLKRTYIVQKGDTLINIAQRHGVSVADVTKQNGIRRDRPIHPGQKLVIPPRKAGTRRAPALPTHVVKSGETLGGIAKRHGVTVADIVQQNEIQRDRPIQPGQKLVIPSSKGSRAARAPKHRTHVVQRGDTLSGLAKRYNVSVAAIMKQNGIGKNKRILIGQKLVIPPSK